LLRNSRRDRKSLFLPIIWLVVAGALLLGPTAAPARTTVVIAKKKGVYHITSLEGPGFRQGLPAPRAREGASRKNVVAVQPQAHDLRPALIQAVNRMDTRLPARTAYPQDLPDLRQIRPGKGGEVSGVSPMEPPANMWTGHRYLGRLLGKFGYPHLLATPPDQAARPTGLCHDLPPILESQAEVRQACRTFLNQPPGPYLFPVQGQPSANPWGALTRFGYCFPVAQPFSFRDSWGDPRPGGRYHQATDIAACEGTPVFAVTGGVIQRLSMGPSSGIMLVLQGHDGRGYGYMHLQGYAPGIAEGKMVQGGELIAYVGHTGIQRDAPHLHFQVWADHRLERNELLNPYTMLVQLSNGRGVTDFGLPKIASRRIPAVNVVNSGTVRLSGVAPHLYQGTRQGVEDASTVYINNF
jgi:murein DD-endopeptidase MepM/ murein hydrolase activator NlpD